MTRAAFNTTCDIYSGPGSSTPGVLIGTFNCRLVVEDGISPVGIGSPTIPAYLTILDYQPVGAWTAPFFGMDPSLADQVAIPSGSGIRWWVLLVDDVDWHGQAVYHRGYLVEVPLPDLEAVAGLVIGGSAAVSFARLLGDPAALRIGVESHATMNLSGPRLASLILGGSTAITFHQAAPAPHGMWTFNDGSGTTFLDSSAFAHHGTLAAALWSVDAPASTGFTNSARFSGSTNGGTVPLSSDWVLPSSGDFSIGCWCKLDSVAFSNKQVIALHDDGTGGTNWMFGVNDGTKLYFQRNTGGSNTILFDVVVTPSSSTWFFMVVTRLGNLWTAYYNGSSVGTTTNAIALPTNTQPLGVAAFTTFNVFNWTGRLSDLRILRAALTSAQVSSWYTTGNP